MSAFRFWIRAMATIIAFILVVVAVYWGVNAYLFTYGANANGIAVAASSAYGSLFLVGAIFLVVAVGFSQLNAHLARLADASEEQTKLLRFIAKQNQKSN